MTVDRMWQIVRLRLRSLMSGASVDRELDEEIRFHLEQQIQSNLAKGVSPDHATIAATRSFGGLEQRKEECRDTRRVGWMIDLVRDARHGLRLLARSPLFAGVAVLSLGIGIGANVAMFSVVDALLLKKLPIPRPDGLVYFVAVDESGFRAESVPYGVFEHLRDAATSFTSISAIWPIERSNLSVDRPDADPDSSALTRVGLTSGRYFETLGVQPLIGRVLNDRDVNHPVAVVSHVFWQRRLASDPAATRHTLHLNGITYDVVGVTPPGFSGEWIGMPVDIWVPFALASQVMPEVPQGPRFFPARVIARLAGTMSSEQAASASAAVYREAVRNDLLANQRTIPDDQLARARVELADASRGFSPQRRTFRQSLLILMAGVALLLVVACANLANLLMARAAARQRELAVRLAVGAGHGRIARQMLTESAVIAVLGGLAGLALAIWMIGILSSLIAAAPVSLAGQSSGLSLDLRIDPRVLLFTTALCLITGMLSGLVPAVAARRVAPASALRASRSLGLGRLVGPSSVLLVAQVAVSLVLLVGAGLFIESLRNLKARDLGLEREHELFVWTVPGQTGRLGDAMADLWHRVQQRLSIVPGVIAVGAANQAVLNGGTTGSGRPGVPLIVEGEPPRSTTRSGGRVFVTPDFFNAAGIRVVAGRDFNERDADETAFVSIINESMARFFFDDPAAAVGRTVQFSGSDKRPHQIVGVVSDYVRTSPRTPEIEFSTYFPYRHPEALNRGLQTRLRVMLVAIRAAGDPLAVAGAVRSTIREIDPMLPVIKINTTEQQLDDVLAQDRLVASLSSALGAIAVFLASLGLFGLLSYRVARRTNEIGVRLAFGATRGSVLRMVMAESGKLIAAGLVAGVVAATLLARFVSSRLFGISPFDPATMAAAMALLTIVAFVAAWIPARQAATVDPSVALRCD